MRSYIRIYGPPLLQALQELEKIAVTFDQVCFMDLPVAASVDLSDDDVAQYFDWLNLKTPIAPERCANIFSRHRELLGDYAFFFEWFVDPHPSTIDDLIEQIDAALAPLGCLYTITTK